MDRMVETNLDVSFLALSARGEAEEEMEMQNMARAVLKASMVHYIPREDVNSEQEFEKHLNSVTAYIYDKATTRGRIASFASRVARLGREGNEICMQMFREAGSQLAELVLSVL